MSYTFICHVEEDTDVALKIALALEGAGYQTWCYEIDSVPGPSYILRTGEAVAQSGALMVLISPNSLGSNQITKEIVRAHESNKHFIPILRDITHVEFQNRQPEWREAIGSATSIRIPNTGVETIIPSILDGVRVLGLRRSEKPDASRIGNIRRILDEIEANIALPVDKPLPTSTPMGVIKRNHKSTRVIIIASTLVIVVTITAIFLLRPFGNGKWDQELSSTTTLPSSTTLLSEEHYQRGLALLEGAQYESAIGEFNKVIDLVPSASAYYNRGMSYYYKGEYDKAIADYTTAIELDPVYASAYNFRGDSYLSKGEYDKAIADFSEAIDINHSYHYAYHDRAIAYYYKKEYDKAISDLMKAIELALDEPDYYSFRGYVYMENMQYELAIADFGKTLELDPTNDSAYFYRGTSYRVLGQKTEAIADLEKCIEISKDPLLIQKAQQELIELK